MSKGVKHSDDIKERCMYAMRRGVAMQDISLVEGVALATLYKWRISVAQDTLPRTKLERLREENAELRAMVARLLAT